MNDRSGDGTGSFEVKVRTQTAETIQLVEGYYAAVSTVGSRTLDLLIASSTAPLPQASSIPDNI